jgi:hypothetical protein
MYMESTSVSCSVPDLDMQVGGGFLFQARDPALGKEQVTQENDRFGQPRPSL